MKADIIAEMRQEFLTAQNDVNKNVDKQLKDITVGLDDVRRQALILKQ